MRPLIARSLALAALVPALFALSVIPGCSNESEGERCGDPGGALGSAVNNSDCGDGLVCVAIPLASGSTDSVNRCCYADHVSDSRCSRNTGVNATSGSAGSAGTAGTAGSSTAGASQAGGAAADSAGAAGAASGTP
jgi:hypothetical protein